MFEINGAALICVRADREVQDSLSERLTLPDNLRRTSGTIEVLNKIFREIWAKSG